MSWRQSQLVPWELELWARSTVLLTRGDLLGAKIAAQEASAQTHWRRRFEYRTTNRATLFDSEYVPYGWVWTEPEQKRALVSSRQLDEDSLDPVLFDQADRMALRGGVPTWCRVVHGVWQAPEHERL